MGWRVARGAPAIRRLEAPAIRRLEPRHCCSRHLWSLFWGVFDDELFQICLGWDLGEGEHREAVSASDEGWRWWRDEAVG